LRLLEERVVEAKVALKRSVRHCLNDTVVGRGAVGWWHDWRVIAEACVEIDANRIGSYPLAKIRNTIDSIEASFIWRLFKVCSNS